MQYTSIVKKLARLTHLQFALPTLVIQSILQNTSSTCLHTNNISKEHEINIILCENMQPWSVPLFVVLQMLYVQQPTTSTQNGQNLSTNPESYNVLKKNNACEYLLWFFQCCKHDLCDHHIVTTTDHFIDTPSWFSKGKISGHFLDDSLWILHCQIYALFAYREKRRENL